MRKSVVFLFLTVLLLAQKVGAQTFYENKEYGISLGGSQYFGDLNDDYGFKFVRPAGGAFIRIHANPFIAVRFSAAYTKVGYDDKLSSNYFNQRRNLNFKSDILEATVQAEFNFFRFFTGELHSRFTPYLTGGIGGFYYNPYTTYNGVRYNLRSLGTEGQLAGYGERAYSNMNICFPVGAGFKYWVRPGFNFGFEIADRLTLTDYIDDVSATYVGKDKFPTDGFNPGPAAALQDRSVEISSDPLGRAGKQRGTSSTRDQYLMFQFNISFQLKTYKCPAYLKEGFFELNYLN
jgi:hypothetical protein